MRFGAIPFHLWAARLTDVVPETALPVLTAFAPASLAVVALAWIDSSVAPLHGRPDARNATSCSPSPSPRSCWRRSPPSSRTTSSTSSATRSSATPASSSWRSRSSGPSPGARPDVDPRLRRRPRRVRGLGRRDPCRVLHRSGRRPARLGAALADPGRRVRAGGRRQRRLPGPGLVRGPRVARRPGRDRAARRAARDRRARAPHLLRAAARRSGCRSPTGSANRSSRGGRTPCART